MIVPSLSYRIVTVFANPPAPLVPGFGRWVRMGEQMIGTLVVLGRLLGVILLPATGRVGNRGGANANPPMPSSRDRRKRGRRTAS